ncbi:MAG: DUF3300 domain-containing protein [Bryobacteraceae bacterium]
MKRNGIGFSGAGSRWITSALSLLLVSLIHAGLYAQTPPEQMPQEQAPPEQMPPPAGYAPMDAMQLDQLVAPIALYPDSLVAQVLTAATFPQQVSEASNWMHQYGGMPPDQLANAVNGMPWDPSVKALIEFPSVLDNMARNYNWTGALGNAYYNQPGDVMNAVQAMRIQAQQAGTLRSTPQQRVYDDGGLVVIEPMNPAFVYVPYYNPWGVYGMAISPWGGYYVMPPPRGLMMAGGIGIGFGMGISLGVFSRYGWGYHAWAPNWHGGVVLYNHGAYVSRSTTVINRGNFGAYNRGVYERGGRGVPNGFRPPAAASGQFHAAPGGGANRPAAGPGTYNRPGSTPAPAYRPGAGGNNRPSGSPSGTYSRPQVQSSPSNTRPQGSYNTGRQPAAPQARPTQSSPSAPPAHTQSNPGAGHSQGSGGGHAQPQHSQGGSRSEGKEKEKGHN